MTEEDADNNELPPAFIEWRAEVDRVMKRDWYIDTDQAGTEIERLLTHWKDGVEPERYVSWFADKYGLFDFN